MPTLGAGGAERVVFELARHLPAYGFDVSVASLMGGGALESFFTSAAIPTRVFQRRGPFGSAAFHFALTAIRETRPQIVHTHLFGADLWGRLAALLSRVPVIVSTEHNAYPDQGFLKRGLKSFFARHTSSVVAVSSVVKEYMKDVDHIPAKKIRLIRNGIDLSRVVPRSTRSFRDVPALIVVGRLEQQKGHATLFKALALVRRPWTLEIAGTGPLERELRNLANRLGIAPRIRWLGYRADVPELLARADLFCFPSRWEGLGLALVEAAAAGVPVLASDLPVLREVLPHEGTYAAAGDVTAWAEALRGILTDPQPAVQRAEQAVSRIHKEFSVDRMVKNYASLYQELLK